jgi:cbb3-type cytochrome oxidase maturation protein
MTILYVIIPIAIILVSSFVFFFIWAVKTEQFDDLETPAHKILIDDWNENIAEQVDKKEKPQISQI